MSVTQAPACPCTDQPVQLITRPPLRLVARPKPMVIDLARLDRDELLARLKHTTEAEVYLGGLSVCRLDEANAHMVGVIMAMHELHHGGYSPELLEA